MRIHTLALLAGSTLATAAHAQPGAADPAPTGPAPGDTAISVSGTFDWLFDGNFDAAAGGELDVGRWLEARTYLGVAGELNRVISSESGAPTWQTRGGLELRHVVVDQPPFADGCGSYSRSTIAVGLRGGLESVDGSAPGAFVDVTLDFDGWNYGKWGHGGHTEPIDPVMGYIAVGKRISV